MTNQEAIQKATITADALASAGKLNPVQAKTFLDFVVDESKLLKSIRTVQMPQGETWTLDKIGIGRRAAVPAEEAKDPGVRRGVTTSKITVVPRQIVVPVEIGDLFRRINIEGESVDDHVIRMFAKQLSNDTEEGAILGDTLGAAIPEGDYFDGGDPDRVRKDSFLGLWDGFLKLADAGNLLDAENANIGASVFGSAIRALPTKFRRNRNALRWLMPADLMELWREKVAGRPTIAGDDALSGNVTSRPMGIEALDVPLLPRNPKIVKHVTLNGTTAASLGYSPISEVIVTRADLGIAPAVPYSATTDYEIDEDAGTIARRGGSTIADHATVKVTFVTNPTMILTDPDNLIAVLSQDVTIEKARDIFRGVNQYVIRTTIGFAVEEATALVKIRNIGTGV